MELLALLLSGCAVGLGGSTPPEHRLRPRRDRTGPRWLAPRPGAMSPRLRWTVGGGLGVGCYLYAADWGWGVGLMLGALVAVGVAYGLGRLESPALQKARERRIVDQPQALELLVGCLAVGLPLRRATREVAGVMDGPIGDDLSGVMSRVDVGLGDREAWAELAGDPCWKQVATDIARAAHAGSGLREVLDHHASQSRRRAAAQRQQRARTLGVRSVFPLMICFLPAFVLIGLVPTVGSFVVRVLGG